MLGKKIKRDLNKSNPPQTSKNPNLNANKTQQTKKNKNQKKQKSKNPETKPLPIPLKVEESKFYKHEDGIDLIEPVETNTEIPQTGKIQESKWINKQRTLVVASRGVSHQERYLVNDILGLLPHAKKECKIEKNTAREDLNDICFNHSCRNSLYFEHRRRELVMWLFRSPDGPCAKFQVRNIHCLNEIKLTGNCLKYSRPLLSFDKSFEEKPHLKLLKEMFTHTFNTPKNHPKTKPFYDHIISFYNVNNQIFFRNYQIVNELKDKFCDGDDVDKLQLIEIGPRFSLNLIRIFDGPLGGKTIFQNPNYMSPSYIIRRNSEKFKFRKVKKTNKRNSLDSRIKNIKENNHEWLNKD